MRLPVSNTGVTELVPRANGDSVMPRFNDTRHIPDG
jgi:hypothetical protein